MANLKQEKEVEVDIDRVFSISEVKACLNFSGKFYILANSFQKIRGLYLLEIDESDLGIDIDLENKSHNFHIKW